MQEAALTCPHCHCEVTHTLHPFLDLAKHPKQKLAILTDSLFSVTCPSCTKQFTVLHELLVVDDPPPPPSTAQSPADRIYKPTHFAWLRPQLH